mgnify:CR=1 FL=1
MVDGGENSLPDNKGTDTGDVADPKEPVVREPAKKEEG